MDLFRKLKSDRDFLDHFSLILEGLISTKSNRDIKVDYKVNDLSIFFFIDGSSILQIIPDSHLEYTYANSPNWEKEIKRAFEIIKKQWLREIKIDQIIKKES